MIRYVFPKIILLLLAFAIKDCSSLPSLCDGPLPFMSHGRLRSQKQYNLLQNISRLLYNLHANTREFIEGALVAFFVDVSQT